MMTMKSIIDFLTLHFPSRILDRYSLKVATTIFIRVKPSLAKSSDAALFDRNTKHKQNS